MSDVLRTEETRRLKLTTQFKKKLDSIMKEREELNKDNQSLQKQLEDFKLGKKILGEGTSEQAMKEIEKDTRIQMLQKLLERERDDLKKEREDNQKEKQRRQRIGSTIVDTLHQVRKERTRLEEEIEKHKHMESSGIVTSQIPSHNGLDEQAAAYSQACNNFEATVALAHSQRVSSQPRVTSQQGKAIEQRERRLTLPKPSADACKRKLVRPSLEQSEESAADAEMTELEGTVKRGKQGEPHEQETEESIPLSAPASSSRKRIASSSFLELKDEFYAQSEDDSIAAPLKRPKGTEALETAVSSAGLPSEFLNLPPSLEGLDVGGAVEAHPLENEITNSTEAQEYDVTMEPAHSKEPLAGLGHDVNSMNEYDASTEYPVKLKETTNSFDDFPINEGQDVHQSAVVAEDEKEGEWVPDTSEQPAACGESEEDQPEFISGEVAALFSGFSETGDGLEIGSSDVLNENKNEKNDNVEEVADGSDKYGEHTIDNDFEQSPVITSGLPEHSPNIHAESTSETVSSSAVSCADEGAQQGMKNKTEVVDLHSVKGGTEEVEQKAAKSGGKTIILTDRAKERALMRQAGIEAPRSPPRGRGRGSGGFTVLLRRHSMCCVNLIC